MTQRSDLRSRIRTALVDDPTVGPVALSGELVASMTDAEARAALLVCLPDVVEVEAARLREFGQALTWIGL